MCVIDQALILILVYFLFVHCFQSTPVGSSIFILDGLAVDGDVEGEITQFGIVVSRALSILL